MGGSLTTGSLIKTSFLKSGTLDMKSITAPAPAPPHSASVGAHLKAAVGVLLGGARRGGGCTGKNDKCLKNQGDVGGGFECVVRAKWEGESEGRKGGGGESWVSQCRLSPDDVWVRAAAGSM